ncbi:glycosyltransferase family 2 protein [Runella zeae]|uniref:glycosyltransferase family 2 protein n=1 Tax=Runella zeae TaxID=94255 RepID=UPI002356755C|nr:glycosyltransferase family 2 protein [Runella zeae]
MISVVIPLYNKEKSIKKTIKSVLEQTYKNFELVIVNDGSTDNSIDVVNEFVDSRIIVYNKKNGGVSSARNYGINVARGEFIMFLDADDIIYSDCLDILLTYLNNFESCSICVGNYYLKMPNGDMTLSSTCKEQGIVENPLKCFYEGTISFRAGVMLFKKNVFNQARFNELICVHEDTELWVKLLKEFVVLYTPIAIHEYIKEYSILSEKCLPLDKEFSYFINIKKVKNKYEKLILMENVLRSIIRRVFLRDYKSALLLTKNNLYIIHFLLWIYLKKK